MDHVSTLYLSEVTLDPRARGVLSLLADTYALHRALCAVFPGVEAGGMGRVLYRVDTRAGMAGLLVQSQTMPDWSRFGPPITRLRGPRPWSPRTADGTPVIRPGQTLRFRLRANPTVKRGGKRRAWLTRADQCAWLERKGTAHGFQLVGLPAGEGWFDPFGDEPEARSEVRVVKRDHVVGVKHAAESAPVRLQHMCVDFDGLLRVTDPERFVQAIEQGIGSAKGFGFGLLSVARPA